jgi:Zn-dependent protease with chaperone function
MYNNLLYFLVAIFFFSMSTVPETPLLPAWASGALLILSLISYERLVRFMHAQADSRSSAGYFRAERKSSILAIGFFGLTTHVCGLKYYLAFLSWGKALPSLVNIAGLLLFFLYLSLMWRVAQSNYQWVFGGWYSTRAFIVSNIKVNLPIVLPWALLSLCYDLVAFISWPALHDLLLSAWGDFLFYVLFLLFVLLIFPPLVRHLWGCTRMPAGPLRDHLLAFCAGQKFACELYLWPLFEGRALTAGVMGLVPGLRYVLITPGLLEVLTLEELEAVMAHEIGHVKKKHLLLYLLLIAGFSLVVGLYAEPLTFFLLSRDLFYSLWRWSGLPPEAMLVVGGTLPLLVAMLLYFRYLFGYFIRNFERQADLHVFSAIDNRYGNHYGSQALISALEKIALLSGNIRDQPSWHHFGISERVAYLERCARDTQERGRHQRKVKLSLAVYLLMLAAALIWAQYLPLERLSRQYQEKYLEAVLLQKVEREPDKALWLQMAGDLMQHKKMEKKALAAYERALTFEPVSPELMNNLAWLLLTSADLQLRDPKRALILARQAAGMRPLGSFLDTLGLACWANGFLDEAVAAEQDAALADPAGRGYYQQQIDRFRRINYQQELKQKQADDQQHKE